MNKGRQCWLERVFTVLWPSRTVSSWWCSTEGAFYPSLSLDWVSSFVIRFVFFFRNKLVCILGAELFRGRHCCVHAMVTIHTGWNFRLTTPPRCNSAFTSRGKLSSFGATAPTEYRMSFFFPSFLYRVVVPFSSSHTIYFFWAQNGSALGESPKTRRP